MYRASYRNDSEPHRAVLALVGGGVRNLIAPCDLPAAVFAEAFEVGDLVVLVLAIGRDPDPDRRVRDHELDISPIHSQDTGPPPRKYRRFSELEST